MRQGFFFFFLLLLLLLLLLRVRALNIQFLKIIFENYFVTKPLSQII